MELGGAGEIVEGVEIEGAVLGDELDVVVVTGVPDRLDDRRPGRVDVGAEGRFVLVEQLAELVRSDGSLSSIRPLAADQTVAL